MMNTRIISIVALTLVPGVSASAAAQQAALPSVPQSLTLAEAVDLARGNNPLLRQTVNDRSGTAWGVRNAYAAFLPSVNASGSMSYAGAGEGTFLSQQFIQPSATVGSSYSLNLSMSLSGRTLTQPGLARARHDATEARIAGAEINLESMVRQQYLAVKQAEAQVGLAELQLRRNDEFLRLAQARYDVGQNTMLDVRQAEVARGQAQVALLQARQAVTVEKLRLFQTMGVLAPDDPSVVSLTDSFPVVEPSWELHELLAEADRGNPDLGALRAQASAARANERAVKSTWLPTLSFSAGWAGFTQQFTNSQTLVNQARSSAQGAVAQCEFANEFWLNDGKTPTDCSGFALTPADEQEILTQNEVFPFDFTSQPFSARLTVSLPLFTQFSRPTQVAEASAQADDAREAVRARQLQVRTDVSQAYYTLATAYETIGIQENNRVAAGEQLRLATERYRVGSGTFFELLDAQVAAQRAEADYINAIYAYHRAIAALENAVGRPLR
jgi:outer membrane protein